MPRRKRLTGRRRSRNSRCRHAASAHVRILGWPVTTSACARLARGSSVAVARAPNGKQVWHTIGASTLYDIEEAREKAREAIKGIKSGGSRDGVETFEAVAEQWLKRHVEAKGLISAPDIRSYLARYLVPSWAGREFSSIRRGDVAKLLDCGGGLKRTYRRRLCAVCDTRALQLVRSSARKLFVRPLCGA